jgi:hypothetical protein
MMARTNRHDVVHRERLATVADQNAMMDFESPVAGAVSEGAATTVTRSCELATLRHLLGVSAR